MTLSAGQLTHSRIYPSLPFRLQYGQEGLEHPSARDMRRYHRGHCGLGPERGFPGQRAHVHCGRAIVWTAALGLECAARAACGTALVARPLTPPPPPGGARSATCPIADSSKATFKFDDAKATKLLVLRGGCIRHGCARGRPPSERALHGPAQEVIGPARNPMCFRDRIQLRRVRVD
jgi:hypothetical protein